MQYHKLVRDRIAKIIEHQGRKPITHIADEKEYYARLKDKLAEEVNEFNQSNKVEELADLLQIIYTILDFKKITREQLETMRRQKNNERGKFLSRLILDEIEA